MKAHIQYSPWINCYVATLLGGEFDNCYGQGMTPKQALASLKIRIHQLEKARHEHNQHQNRP